MNTLPRRSLLGAALATGAVPPGRAAAQVAPPGYPDRTITLVVPFTPGGSTDIAARILADRAAPKLGPNARIVVENRSGAGGALGGAYVRDRPADGHALLMATASSHGSNPAALPASTPYDPVADFTAVAPVGGGPMLVVVPRGSPITGIEALFAALRERPGGLTWATSGAGGIGHLTGALMLARAGGLRAEHVPYRGGAQVMEAMVKGEVDFSVEVLASSAPHLRDGTSRGLAVSGAERHPLVPELPTLREAGLDGFDITTWNLLLGPRGMPAPVVEALSRAVNATLAEPSVAERLRAAGVDPAPPSTPASASAFLQSELRKFRDAVRDTGLDLAR